MIEHQQLGPAVMRGEGSGVVHLSSPSCARWAGFHILPPRDQLDLLQHSRHDVQVVRGALKLNGRAVAAGTFVSRGQALTLCACDEGGAFFVYSDSLSTASGHETVAPSERIWHQGAIPGMAVAPLSKIHHRVSLVAWQAGTRAPVHTHPFGEELFVLRGELQDERGAYPAGAWLRLHAGSSHAPFAEQPTLILLRSGHLGQALQSAY